MTTDYTVVTPCPEKRVSTGLTVGRKTFVDHESDYGQNWTTLSPVTNKSKLRQNLRKKGHWLYVFLKKTNKKPAVNSAKCETTARAHDAFCPLTQAWPVNCPFNCPITLSKYKRDAHTVLFVLKSRW